MLNGLETTGIGQNIRAGIADGLVSGNGWDSDAQTVASDLLSALNSAFVIHSPSGLTKPVGQNVSAGVGSGMADYDFSSAASTMASNAVSATSAALSSSKFHSVGMQAMNGIR